MRDQCKEFLPARPALGHQYIDSPLLPTIEVEKEDDNMMEEVQLIKNKCEELARSNMATLVGNC